MMRLFGFVCAVMFAGQAWAADIALDSRIDAVTVFPNGAEVIRVGRVRVPKGSHRVVLSGLPSRILEGSVRVEAKASGGLEIGAVDSRRLFVIEDHEKDGSSGRIAIEKQIEGLQDQVVAWSAEIEIRTAQKQFIENLVALPNRPAPKDGEAADTSPDRWSALYDLIGGRLADAQGRILTLQKQIRETNRQIADLQKKLAELAPKKFRKTEVSLNVIADKASDAEFVVSYQVRRASWRPIYDARLTTGSRNVPAQLSLVRRAVIRQQTGEAWDAVAVSLSTTRPAARSGAPDLGELIVDFPSPPPVAAASPKKRAQGYGRRLDAMPAPQAEQDRAASAELKAPAIRQTAEVQTAAFQAIFKVPGRLSVPETGVVSRFKIDETSLEPALVVRSVPKRDQQAYLYAKITLPKTAPYLPGEVYLFRDRTFVGTGRLPQLAPGEKHELGFGADDLVRVTYHVLKARKGETGLISSSRTNQRQYKIVIRNLHERPVAYTVLDQLPVSAEETISVKMMSGTTPTTQNVDDKRGVVAWSGKLGAEEEKTINFGYVISWPSDRKIIYR